MNEIILADCMDIMKDMPDGYIDLAIVDPPYGIDIENMGGRGGKSTWKGHNRKNWDNEIPDKKYFDELFRVSNNQIIWGGNYFTKYLPSSMGWVFWDKMKHTFSTSDGELAYTSFNSKLKVFQRYVNMDKGFMNKSGGDIHPTQKPVALYRWLLQNYAKPGQLILDTHSGSGSLACACHLEKFDFIAIEKDKDYHRDSVKRLNELRSQGTLF